LGADRPALVCIVGPTASGKSAIALGWAERLGAEIVSCDSVAVYRGLDVGSAKPTPADRARVRHHLIDVAEPSERFSAARFAAAADGVIAEIASRGRSVLVVGGSGLYLRALTSGLAPTPAPDPALRARHRETPLAELRARLLAVDPTSAARIGTADFVRISRALEVYEQTGVPLSRHFAAQAGGPRYRALVLALDPPRPELYARIDARVDAMMAAGFLDEVRALTGAYGADAPALRSVGYAQLALHLADQIDLVEAIRRIRRETRRFARRQRTWLRGQPGVLWYASASELPFERAAHFLRMDHDERDG
jgi:tRNA dimethylallyltransferase